jgi:hypothetical protein
MVNLNGEFTSSCIPVLELVIVRCLARHWDSTLKSCSSQEGEGSFSSDDGVRAMLMLQYTLLLLPVQLYGLFVCQKTKSHRKREGGLVPEVWQGRPGWSWSFLCPPVCSGYLCMFISLTNKGTECTWTHRRPWCQGLIVSKIPTNYHPWVRYPTWVVDDEDMVKVCSNTSSTHSGTGSSYQL